MVSFTSFSLVALLSSVLKIFAAPLSLAAWPLLLSGVGALPAGSRLGARRALPSASADVDDPESDTGLVADLTDTAGPLDPELPDCGHAPAAEAHTVPLTKQRVPVKSRGQTIYKTIFSGKISVGTPAQEFTVVFDTGSGHLIIPGPTCRSPSCVKHQQYNSSSSSGQAIDYDGTPVTGKARDQLTVSFGTGEVTGVFSQDTVCVAGGRRCVEGAHLITATEMTDKPFLEFDFDGVLGLGLAGLSQTPAFNMAQRLGGGDSVFAVYLGHCGSEISFGSWRPQLLRGALQWADVKDAEEGYWKLAVDAVVVDGTPLEVCAGGCNAVADTGTSVLAGPSAAVTLIREQLSSRLFMKDGVCAIDGDAAIEVVLAGGLRLSLGAADYAQPRLNANQTATACELLLMKMDVPPPLGPLFILGEPILTKYYTVFDATKERVGFGLAADDCAEESVV